MGAAVCGLLLLLLAAATGAPPQRQQRLVFSPSRRANTESFPFTSIGDLPLSSTPSPVLETADQFQFPSSVGDSPLQPAADEDGQLIFPSPTAAGPLLQPLPADGTDGIQFQASNTAGDSLRASSGRLIFSPERLIFSGSRRRAGPPPSPSPLASPPSPAPSPLAFPSPQASPPSPLAFPSPQASPPSPLAFPAPQASPPSPVAFPSSQASPPSPSPSFLPAPAPSPPPQAEDGMAHLQEYLQQVRLTQAAGRSQQTLRAAAAARTGPRPRVGPRTPEAVAANPDAATAPRGGAGRDPPAADEPVRPLVADSTPRDRESEAQDWSSNLLDSAARAGLRSPGAALEDVGPADEPYWSDLPSFPGSPEPPAAEEAEDTVWGGAMQKEDLFYHGPLPQEAQTDTESFSPRPGERPGSFSPSPVEEPDSYSLRPLSASAQLLEEVEAVPKDRRQGRRLGAPPARQPEYLADLLRLGTDFVYLPGLSGLNVELGTEPQTAGRADGAAAAPAVTELPTRQSDKGPDVVYVYIVRGDGQTLDLYATDGRRSAATGEPEGGSGRRRTAAVVADEDGELVDYLGTEADAQLNEIETTTEDLEGAADSSTSHLLSVVDGWGDGGTAGLSGLGTERGEGQTLTPRGGNVNKEEKGEIKSVYFDPADQFLMSHEEANKVSVGNELVKLANVDDVSSSSEDLSLEERGIFFFPGNVIHSFGIAPSSAGSPVVVSVPRPGVPSVLSSVNQSTPIAELLTPPDQPLQTLAAAAAATPVDRQDTAELLAAPSPPPPPPTAAPAPTARPLTGRPVIFTESPPVGDALLAGPTGARPQFVFPGGSSATPVQGAGDADAPFRFPSPEPDREVLDTSSERPLLFSSGRPAAVTEERTERPPAVSVPSDGGQCRPEPDCALLSRRRRGCSASADCPAPQRCCFSQCLGVSVCQEGTFRERLAGLAALADVVVP